MTRLLGLVCPPGLLLLAVIGGCDGQTTQPSSGGKGTYGSSYGSPYPPDPPYDSGVTTTGGELVVDGIVCTEVATGLETKFAPLGHTWRLDVRGTCGALGVVEAQVAGDDSAAYPQSCAGVAAIRVSIGGEGDAGSLAYDGSQTLGSCSIQSGPTLADESAAASLTATVENQAGKTHTLSYAAVGAAATGDF